MQVFSSHPFQERLSRQKVHWSRTASLGRRSKLEFVEVYVRLNWLLHVASSLVPSQAVEPAHQQGSTQERSRRGPGNLRLV